LSIFEGPWDAFLVHPLMAIALTFYSITRDFGLAIILLTIAIRLAVYPLYVTQIRSQRAMQELGPAMNELKAKYGKDRQRFGEEQMKLYRERGVNPASGCVPMLLTMPVLFAFYAMLSVAIELRGAPFIGWIKDLSVHDPLFITPVLMGITQFVQTKMTPASGDPAQQKMMLFMPLIFMSMFIWAPSGLVLYWTVSNLWAIGQQAVTARLIGPAPQRVVRPAAERRLKTAGAGKSSAAKERK
jgi:YidC/Oxa1 family membrane protein insertase